MNQKNSRAAAFFDVRQIDHDIRLLLGMFIFDPDGFADLISRKSGFMKLSRVQRDVLTHGSAKAVIVREAVQITLMTRGPLASAITLNLLQDFGNIPSRLIRFSCSSGEHRWRKRCVLVGHVGGRVLSDGLLVLWRRRFRTSENEPRGGGKNRDRDEHQPGGTPVFTAFVLFLLLQWISSREK